MIRNLPYTSLRSFESVARLGSFSRAADEMNVTQSAVSQHVKALEEWTGCVLLHRSRAGSKPTAEGIAMAAAIANGLGQISDLCTQLQSRNARDAPIILASLPGFAVNWLFPRLIHFDQANPELSVSIHTNTSSGDLVAGDCDLSIRYGLGNYRGMYVERLLSETLTPVCAPSLLSTGPALNTVDDLARHTLLIDDISDLGGEPPTWSYWAERAGLTMPKPANTRRFGQSNMVVQAAIEGYGVALGRSPLIQASLATGALVAPLPHQVPSQYAYWLVCAKQALRAPRLRLFRDWLVQEATEQTRVENYQTS
ncbi:LysR family transcriptional regulator [Pseudohalocynthiibacter aestuariivivens]|nr:LysR substrate-binding domain-containing protein [Pseudohalocynthiibacter aestuariivivens]QIE44288.1 LysR family transcriptional regulator [Pseudohalocynthiibacter aestuariivivens]